MGTNSEQADLQGDDAKDGQREALEDSQKQAARQQPDNFKDDANGDKKVEIGSDLTDAPIQGIDPAG